MTFPTPVSMLLFDLDDTLVDDAIATEAAVAALFQHYRPEQASDALNHWKRALKLYYPAFLHGKLTAEEMRQARIREAFQQPAMSNTLAEQAFEFFMRQYIAATQLYPDTLACLDELLQHGWRLALVSNGPEDMQQRKVKAAGLHPYFEFVLTAEVAGAAKPDAAIFEQALARAKLNSHACCYVGDNLTNDAKGAVAAGLSSVWLQRQPATDLEFQPLAGVTWKISSLAQLTQCISLG